MDDGSRIIGSVVCLLLLVINFFLYGFSAAITTMNGNQMHEKAEQGDKRALLLTKIVDSPRAFVNTVRINMVLLCVLSGLFVLPLVGQKVASVIIQETGFVQLAVPIYIAGYVFAGLLAGLVIISIGMIMPKRIGAKYADAWAFAFVSFSARYIGLWAPLRFVYANAANVLLLLFGIRPKDEFENVTEEEIKSMVNEGHEQGVIESSEAEMIANIFEFGGKEAQDIMTHRKSIILIDGEMTLKETVDFILKQNNSRFPVYLDDIDNIIGVLHLKDTMILSADKELADKKIKDIRGFLRKAVFIPETRKIDVLFRSMQSTQTHLVIVIDEYGQTSGIITMEDILEEIVGNILDEYDVAEKNILSRKDNVFVVKGMVPIDELEETTGLTFEEDDYETLNGFLISQLDRIPKEDERPEITVDGVLYKVLNVENKMISLVKITIPKQTQNAKEEKEKEEN